MTKKPSGVSRIPDSEGVARAIDYAIEKIQEQLESDQQKLSVSDLVRLIQLRNELAGNYPMDVTARWVD